jgi:hypothetical protein
MKAVTPSRVRMRRDRPWRKDHPEAVIVDRRTRWGNPFRVGGTAGFALWFAGNQDGLWCGPTPGPNPPNPPSIHVLACDPFRATVWAPIPDPYTAVFLYRRWLDAQPDWRRSEIRTELGGKDLACWCPLSAPCHADVLLEIANPRGKG